MWAVLKLVGEGTLELVGEGAQSAGNGQYAGVGDWESQVASALCRWYLQKQAS